jgi:hypothetical protein
LFWDDSSRQNPRKQECSVTQGQEAGGELRQGLGRERGICKVSASGVNIKEMSSHNSRLSHFVFVGLEFALEPGYAHVPLGGASEMPELS